MPVTVTFPETGVRTIAPLFTPVYRSMPQSNIISVTAQGQAKWRGQSYRCAIGDGGVGSTKREGDGATPMGCFFLRGVMFRPDRLDEPKTGLAVSPIAPDDGWCDAPDDAAYNKHVRLPYRASAERLWRDDHVYDLIVVLGHNDRPVVPGCGSAIFIHVATPDYAPTAGCVALERQDLIAILADCDPTTQICILS